MQKVVRIQSKGMVTIPIEYRKKLRIDENSLFEVKVTGTSSITFQKIDFMEQTPIFTDKEIEEWVEADKLDPKTKKRFSRLLK